MAAWCIKHDTPFLLRRDGFRPGQRPGNINAWDNEEFVAAVKATGKKQLLIAGIVTEVCVAFPALSALFATHLPSCQGLINSHAARTNVDLKLAA